MMIPYKSKQLTREVKYDDDVCDCFASLSLQSKERKFV
jgi:hypothetical protein